MKYVTFPTGTDAGEISINPAHVISVQAFNGYGSGDAIIQTTNGPVKVGYSREQVVSMLEKADPKSSEAEYEIDF